MDTTEVRVVDPVTGGQKGQKLCRMDLLPWEVVTELAEHYGRGSKKYDRQTIISFDNIQEYIRKELGLCPSVQSIQIVECIVTDYVEPATKRISAKLIRSLDPVNWQMQEPGIRTILNELNLQLVPDKPIHIVGKGTEALNSEALYDKEASPLRPLRYYWNNKEISAESVERFSRGGTNIWITIIRRGSQEAIYVMGATAASECLGTVFQVLSGQSLIYAIPRVQSISNDRWNLTLSGDRNWEKGYAWSLSYAAALRHLTQFWCGEDNDEETKTKHVICAAWHCLALAWFMMFKPEHDDRPSTARRRSDQQKSPQEPCQPPTGADDPCCLPSH